MLNKSQRLLFERQAEIARAMAHPLRITIINFLKDGEQCVCDIAKNIGSERSNVSRHLSVMANAGLLESRKDGLKVIYKLKYTCIVDFFACVGNVLKQQARDSKELLKAL